MTIRRGETYWKLVVGIGSARNAWVRQIIVANRDVDEFAARKLG